MWSLEVIARRSRLEALVLGPEVTSQSCLQESGSDPPFFRWTFFRNWRGVRTMGPRVLLLEREGAADEGSAIDGSLNGQFRLTKCASQKALLPKH